MAGTISTPAESYPPQMASGYIWSPAPQEHQRIDRGHDSAEAMQGVAEATKAQWQQQPWHRAHDAAQRGPQPLYGPPRPRDDVHRQYQSIPTRYSPYPPPYQAPLCAASGLRPFASNATNLYPPAVSQYTDTMTRYHPFVHLECLPRALAPSQPLDVPTDGATPESTFAPVNSVPNKRKISRPRYVPSLVGTPGFPPARTVCRFRVPMDDDDDQLIIHLKEEKDLGWREIEQFFPGRSANTLQVRYCRELKKLKNRDRMLSLQERIRFRKVHGKEQREMWHRVAKAFRISKTRAKEISKDLLLLSDEDALDCDPHRSDTVQDEEDNPNGEREDSGTGMNEEVTPNIEAEDLNTGGYNADISSRKEAECDSAEKEEDDADRSSDPKEHGRNTKRKRTTRQKPTRTPTRATTRATRGSNKYIDRRLAEAALNLKSS